MGQLRYNLLLEISDESKSKLVTFSQPLMARTGKCVAAYSDLIPFVNQFGNGLRIGVTEHA